MLRVVCLSLTFSLLAACGGDDGDAGDGISNPDASNRDAGALSFMDACDVLDDQCDSDVGEFCFSFNSKGPHCTRSCEDETDCSVPSPGCNNMGVCKAPD